MDDIISPDNEGQKERLMSRQLLEAMEHDTNGEDTQFEAKFSKPLAKTTSQLAEAEDVYARALEAESTTAARIIRELTVAREEIAKMRAGEEDAARERRLQLEERERKLIEGEKKLLEEQYKMLKREEALSSLHTTNTQIQQQLLSLQSSIMTLQTSQEKITGTMKDMDQDIKQLTRASQTTPPHFKHAMADIVSTTVKAILMSHSTMSPFLGTMRTAFEDVIEPYTWQMQRGSRETVKSVTKVVSNLVDNRIKPHISWQTTLARIEKGLEVVPIAPDSPIIASDVFASIRKDISRSNRCTRIANVIASWDLSPGTSKRWSCWSSLALGGDEEDALWDGTRCKICAEEDQSCLYMSVVESGSDTGPSRLVQFTWAPSCPA